MSSHLRLVSNTFAPWITFKNGLDKGCEGINFTYEFIKQAIGTGIRLPNGSWTGTIGRIHQGVRKMTYNYLLKIFMTRANIYHLPGSRPYRYACCLVP